MFQVVLVAVKRKSLGGGTKTVVNSLTLSSFLHPHHLAQNMDPQVDPSPAINGTGPRDSKGWDGKLRVDRRAVVTNAEILSDPEYSDEDAPPVDQIDADEGRFVFAFYVFLLTSGCTRPAGRL